MDTIITEIVSYAPLETGGAFFGYQAENNDIVITHLISSGPKAKHKKFSFEPDQEYQLSQMEIIYYENEGRLSYLGDWHSHPVSSPLLSRRDEKTLLNIAFSESAKCSRPLMIIFGSLPEKWSVNAVRFSEGMKYFGPFYKCKYESLLLVVD
ncbi:MULTISPECIES: Mov34/MPN/PAD-1 family protein [Vibrio harveyi group]|uniref:Mov34/MPN/PAD-1 family protein n=1 Tax=Vibrio harveyi group TaxID=717610 RepID=UPI00155892A0|nr:Mov34/MPN/PAD-1 family protein [Vibrio parahaemolyticus]MCR9964038.1 Mov34/MPN/PAD-1 family protein [Vibrio antiquarius]EII3114138.1 Mov34/MPN/PAD-1 family protein [Vibrio parahaemolyticus]EIV1638248.1 Mov34/MPN/PAD-1 family protein [Vibrio parahaemolyticus]EJC6857345.1 Mov34/MPN/PAD-1 family protein [Vibrio parahaemolyticus]EJM7848649.1 Mov34/MPN/PAD-1 family protein [Vibrio parahaemolyticus]